MGYDKLRIRNKLERYPNRLVYSTLYNSRLIALNDARDVMGASHRTRFTAPSVVALW